MKTSIPIKDGVVDVVYSPDDSGYYLHRYLFGEKKDQTSKRTYSTEREALEAFRNGRVRWAA